MNLELGKLERLFPFHVFDEETQSSRGEEVKLNDFIALSRLLSDCRPMNILEIGCWTGSCTVLFGDHVKEYGGKVHVIDNFKGSPGSNQEKFAKVARRRFLDNVKTFGLEDTVIFHEGNSDDLVDLFGVEFDFIFIDADHRYSQISKDIANYYPKLKDGGYFCGHDFNCSVYDEKHIEEDYVDGIHHGVTKAVNERFPGVKLFTDDGDNKRRLISSVWHVVKDKMPCFVAMD